MTSTANIGDAPAHTYAELLSGPLVDVFVGTGDSKRQWSLHRNLLSYHSEYLASELQTNDATKNKPGNRLELTDDDPKGFELLVKWLYQGKLEDVADILGADNKYSYAVACHSLYMLCERFDMPQLKNMAIDQYRKGLRQAQLVPDADEINDIYQKAPDGSPFRMLMTRIAARQIMDPDNERDAGNYRACFEASPEFAVDLVNAIKSSTGGVLFDDPTSGDECLYHDHEDGPNCHAKGKGAQGIRRLRLRPHSPPSPPRTPPDTRFAANDAHASDLQKSRSSTKVHGIHSANDHDGGPNDGNASEFGDGDAGEFGPPSPASFKPRLAESAIGPESPGGRSPKRHPPKLRRRGSTSARNSPSQGHF